MIQFTLPLLLEFYNEGRISLETIAMAAAHNPAVRYQIRDRGFIREGYFADLTAFSADELTVPSESSILSLCGWSCRKKNKGQSADDNGQRKRCI